MSNDNKKITEEIGKIVKPIFNKVLKETGKTRILGGSEPPPKDLFTYLQPHNYRLYFDFNKEKMLGLPDPPKTKSSGVTTIKKINYGKNIQFSNYKGCRLVVLKTQILVNNKIEHKRWYAIDRYKAEEQIKEFIEKKLNESIQVLKDFIKEFGGSSEFQLKGFYEETKVSNDILVDKLPKRLTYHARQHKKVYKEKAIETFSLAKTVNLIENNLLLNHQEEIGDILKNLAYGVNGVENTARKIHNLMHKKVKPALAKSKARKPLNFKQLKKAVQTMDDGIKHKQDIQSLSFDENWELAGVLKQRIFSARI